jgi:hypothetical protein
MYRINGREFSSLISSQKLKARLHEPTLRILDASMPFAGKNPWVEFQH